MANALATLLPYILNSQNGGSITANAGGANATQPVGSTAPPTTSAAPAPTDAGAPLTQGGALSQGAYASIQNLLNGQGFGDSVINGMSKSGGAEGGMLASLLAML